MHILGVHGDLLEGLFLHILGWMLASNLSGGTTGTSLRMNEVHVSMSIGKLHFVRFKLVPLLLPWLTPLKICFGHGRA